VGDFHGNLRLWDLSRRQPTDLGNHNGQVIDLAVSADGSRAVTAGFDKRLLLWDLENRKLLREIMPQPVSSVLTVAMTADARTVVAGCDNGHIQAWDLRSDKATTLIGHKGAVSGVAVSADGSRLVSGGKDGTVRLWDLVQRREIEGFREERPGEVLKVALTADGKHALTGSRGGISARGQLQNTVRLWRLP
jgi:WD40 repeat protein